MWWAHQRDRGNVQAWLSFSPPLLANWQLSKPGKQLFKFLLSTVTACPAPELLAPYCSLVSRSNWIEGFTGMAFQKQVLKLCLESFPTFCLLNTDYPDIWQSGSITDLKSLHLGKWHLWEIGLGGEGVERWPHWNACLLGAVVLCWKEQWFWSQTDQSLGSYFFPPTNCVVWQALVPSLN